MVGPAPSATISRPVELWRNASAAEIATRNRIVFQRGYALVIYNANDCAEDTTLRNSDGSWALQHPFLSRVSGLRLGRFGGVGLGRIAYS